MSEEVLALREQVDKLKKKLDKERQQFERELEAQKSVIETLKSTIAHNREAYQDISRQLEDEKNKSLHYHKLSQERKRKVKDLELALQREKQNLNSSPSFTSSAPPTPVHPSSSSSAVMNGHNGSSNHFRSQSLDVTKEKLITKSITFTSGENTSPPNSVYVPNGNALGLSANKPAKKRLGEHSGDEREKPLKPKGKMETPPRGSKNSEIDEVVSDPESKGLLGSKSNGAIDRRTVRKSVSFEKVPFTDNNNPNVKEENGPVGHAQPLTRSPSVKVEPKNISFTITSPDLTLHSSFPNDMTIRQVIAKLRLKFPGDTSLFHLYVKEKKGFYKELAEDKTLAAYKELEDPKIVVLFQSTLPVEGRSRFGTLFGFGGGNDDKDRRKTVVAMDFTAKKEALAEAINRNDFETVHTITNSLPVGMLTEGTNELGQNMLHLAVKCNSTGIFQIILNAFKVNNLNVNLPDVHGWTALHYAVSNDTGNSSDEEILTGLLEVKTLNVEHENLDKNTALHYFCQKFIGTSASQLGEMIISRAPGLVNRRNKNGETPLHKAIYNPQIRVMLVKLLLNHGADTNIQTEIGGETALHYAVRLGRKDILKFLLQSGAQMKIKDKVNGKTPYELAIETNEKDAISALKAAQDLKDWLEGLQQGDHFQSFIKYDLTLEIVSQCDVAFLDSMMTEIGITAPETRSKIKDACKVLGDTLSKKAFEIRLKTVSGGKFGGANEQIKVNTDNIKKAISELKYTKRAADDQSWLISHKEIEFTKELGSGTSATVFKGLYKGTKVAIKVLKAQQNAQKTDATIEEFKKEFHVMSAVLSPNIVQFYGACLEPRICIVMEYCKNKSLYHVLKNEKLLIDWPRFFKFSIEMVAAIDSLHKLDPPIFHRDLKSLNLLLNKDWVIKLSDFGLARFQTAETQDTLKKLCGTYSYASPELFFGRPYTDKCDIFSVAVVLWEMAFRVMKGKYEAPYSEFPQLKVDYQIFFHVAKKAFRPTIVQGTPPILVELITRSWDEDANKRPSSTEMLSDLILMETEYQQNTPKWDALVFNGQK